MENLGRSCGPQDSPTGLLNTLRPAADPLMNHGLRRADFVHLTLDPNTAHRRFRLSEDLRTVTLVSEEQPYPDHPDRFDWFHQVLGSTGLTGRCYWEVDWSGWCDVAVTYGRIHRKGRGDGCVFGDNGCSWSLRIYDGHFYVCHGNVQEPVCPVSSSNPRRSAQVERPSGRVGVYLDSEAGSLSFYEILAGAEPSHLHTFRATFTQPLFPGFGVWIVFAQRSSGNSMSLVSP